MDDDAKLTTTEPEWQALLRDVEERIGTVSAALDDVRSAMRRLLVWEPPAAPEAAPVAPVQTVAQVEMPVEVDAKRGDELQEAPAPEETVEPDQEALREEVRRVVEAARAELEAGPLKIEEDSPIMHSDEGRQELFAPPRREPAAGTEDLAGPWNIVLEDPEGRVELARVYDLLNRLECAAQAVLLNYTPHSVTVALNPRVRRPPQEAIETGVQGAFGRRSEVVTDGMRIAVRIMGLNEGIGRVA